LLVNLLYRIVYFLQHPFDFLKSCLLSWCSCNHRSLWYE
jgi:hypothetical protein